MGLFASKPQKKSQVTSHDRAVLELKVARDKLYQHQKKLTVLIDKEVAASKQCLKEGKKEKAIVIMKRKRMKESMLLQADQQLTNVQTLVDQVETSQLQARYVEAMKEGTKTLKAIQAEFSVDYVEKIMDDSAEALAMQQEINELLADSLTPEQDAECLDEIREMEAQMLKDELDAGGKVPDAPLPDAKEAAAAAAAAAAAKATAEAEAAAEEEEEPERQLASA